MAHSGKMAEREFWKKQLFATLERTWATELINPLKHSGNFMTQLS
jgi:hypothetical protein